MGETCPASFCVCYKDHFNRKESISFYSFNGELEQCYTNIYLYSLPYDIMFTKIVWRSIYSFHKDKVYTLGDTSAIAWVSPWNYSKNTICTVTDYITHIVFKHI